MKGLQIKIFLILIPAAFLFSCSQDVVCSDDLKLAHGVMVLKADSTPFSGICKDFFNNGAIQSEKSYSDGLLDGEFNRYYKNGQVSVHVQYKMGEPIGGFKQYFENGKLKAEKTDNGKTQILTRWYENGIKNNEIHFENNILNGTSEQWYKNGQKEFTCSYKNDKRTGQFISWYENGKKKIEGRYSNGELDGKWLSWNENEIIKSEEHYNKGKKTDTWIYFFDSGKKRIEILFKDGLTKRNTEWDEQGRVISSFESE